MAGMAAATMVATSMIMVMFVVAAANARIISQLTHQQCLYCLVSIAADAAKQLDTSLCQRHLCAATDAAADQYIDTLGFQKACQGAMTKAGRIHHLGRRHLILLDLIDLKMGGMAKVLENEATFISNCDFH